MITSAATLAGAVLGVRAAAGRGVPLGAPAQDPIQKTYEKDHPREAKQRTELASLHATARKKALETTKQLLERPDAIGELRPRLHLLQELERSLATRLAPLDAHFAAWRASTITTVDETFEVSVPISQLPTKMPPPDWPEPCSATSPRAPATLRDLWERYGLTVVAEWAEGRQAQAENPAGADDRIYTRRPDQVVLIVMEHREKLGVGTKRSQHLVIDDHCVVESFPIKKSLFGRRSMQLSFSSDGFLTGIAVEGASTLAALATAAGQIPANLAVGVESVTKTTAGLATAGRASLEAELARVKGEVELRQQKLLAAGLDATAADATRLERLQQLQDILESQTAIRDADPGLVARLRKEAAADLDWYEPPPPAPKQEQTITVLLKPAPAEPAGAGGDGNGSGGTASQ